MAASRLKRQPGRCWYAAYVLFGVKKKNIYVGIIVHILCNMMNVVTGVAFIVRVT